MSLELGNQAVACKDWRWMPGMLCQQGRISTTGGGVSYCTIERRIGHDTANLVAPDLNDPATLGCLLALVLEKHERPGYEPLEVIPPNRDKGLSRWSVLCQSLSGGPCYTVYVWGDSYAEVLVAALEAE